MIAVVGDGRLGRNVRHSRRTGEFLAEIGRDAGHELRLEIELAGRAIVMLVRVRLGNLNRTVGGIAALMLMDSAR